MRDDFENLGPTEHLRRVAAIAFRDAPAGWSRPLDAPYSLALETRAPAYRGPVRRDDARYSLTDAGRRALAYNAEPFSEGCE